MTRHDSLSMQDALSLAVWMYVVLGIRCKVRITNHIWTVNHF